MVTMIAVVNLPSRRPLIEPNKTMVFAQKLGFNVLNQKPDCLAKNNRVFPSTDSTQAVSSEKSRNCTWLKMIVHNLTLLFLHPTKVNTIVSSLLARPSYHVTALYKNEISGSIHPFSSCRTNKGS